LFKIEKLKGVGVRFWVEKKKRIEYLLFSKSEGYNDWIFVLMSGVRMEGGIARFCFFHREMNKQNELWNIGSWGISRRMRRVGGLLEKKSRGLRERES
jgi:hypothetical protein